jgi:hypothetical protein
MKLLIHTKIFILLTQILNEELNSVHLNIFCMATWGRPCVHVHESLHRIQIYWIKNISIASLRIRQVVPFLRKYIVCLLHKVI